MIERNRIIAMSGGHNFRDVGGYATSDGRVTAWGRVFRSGTMAELDETDRGILDGLGLELICDFRSTQERDRRPSRLSDAARDKIWSRDYRTSAADLVKALTHRSASPELARGMMIDLYREILFEQMLNYRAFFEHVAAGRLPILFHCAAGKDRTGVAAALLLEILGVPRETIIDDYVLTNRFFDRGVELVRNDPWARRLREIDENIWAPVMYADPAYLNTMFDVLDTRYGSAQGYVRQELQIDEDAIAVIRSRLIV